MKIIYFILVEKNPALCDDEMVCCEEGDIMMIPQPDGRQLKISMLNKFRDN